MRRRKNPSVPFFFPDWIVLRELSRDVRYALQKYGTGRLLDVGCGEKPYLPFASNVTEWIGFDDPANASADVHGRAESLPFESSSFDTVLCTQVIEHIPDPQPVLSESARVLKPGGIIILTAPQYWALHELPHDYHRFTRFGLQYIMEKSGFEIVETRLEGTGAKVAAQSFNLAVQSWGASSSFGRAMAFRLAKVPIYAVVNALAVTAGALLFSDQDALNIMMIGRKP